MKKLSMLYEENRAYLSTRLRVGESFDIIEKRLKNQRTEFTFFYIDGFVKEGDMLRIMQHVLTMKEALSAEDFLSELPYVEAEVSSDCDFIIKSVLSGQTVTLSPSFGRGAVLIDARTYPARPTAEPDSDRVMQGAHDGFVETLVTNTTLIRRRIRDTRLTFKCLSLGGASRTDVAVCYMNGVADAALVCEILQKLKDVRPKSLTLGFQSLAETLVRRGWYNPFPKIRTTERPDAAAAHLMEGSVLVICDTSPQVMILPTSIFDYLQQTDDYYFPPLTGSYMRLVRMAILLLSVVATPLWYLYLEYAESLPDALRFLIPDDPGALPIILQLFLVELAIDGLKIASMNTPDMLSNSLSVVGALLLGDFAVAVGWVCPDVVLYMAFVAIANFAQQNHELGYAFKFCRMIILFFTYILGIWGFGIGIVVCTLLVVTNNTPFGRSYLYPLIPFDGRAMKRLIVRERKRDFETEGE